MSRVRYAASIQRRLMAYYGLGSLPDVDGFVVACEELSRERLLVRHAGDTLELRLELPADMLQVAGPLSLDQLCQLVEGVSHFVLVAERGRHELPTTQLELELQAEIDKFIALGVAAETPLDAGRLAELHGRLFDGARFLHAPDSERGERYRTAHRLAVRYLRRLFSRYIRFARHEEMRRVLRDFYRAGPRGKIALARAA